MNWKKLSAMWRWILLLVPFVLLVWCLALVASVGRLQERVVVYVGAISRLGAIEEALRKAGPSAEPAAGLPEGTGTADSATARLRDAYRELAIFLDSADPARGDLLPVLTETHELPEATEELVDALEREARGENAEAGSVDRAATRVREAVRRCRSRLAEISRELAGRWQSLSTLAMLACGVALGAAVLFIVTYEREIVRTKRAEALTQASQRMEAIGRLAGGVAHDFNNLLTVVLGHAELLMDELGEQDESAVAHAEEISGAALRAAALTDQLLAFGRRQTLHPKVLDLNVMVVDLARMLARVIGDEIRLVTAIEERPVWVQADPIHLEQVLMNLAINARDAMPQGGGLTISSTHLELSDQRAARVQDLAPGSYARLAVSDEGVGMDEATLGRIFEPFFTTKEVGKGTGLGLATVYGIVQQAGGGIRVESREGEGTTFEVYLPASDPMALSVVHSAVGPQPIGSEGEHRG